MTITKYQARFTLLADATNAGLSSRAAELNRQNLLSVTSGTGAGQINTWFDDLRELAGAGRVVTISGTPTGGTFTLTASVVEGDQATAATTAAIAYNASAATVQTALQALSNVGSGLATVTGSAGGPYAVSFDTSLGAVTLTATASLTGGSAPAVAVTYATASYVASVATAPTLGTATTTGTLAPGTYYVKYSYYTANGETVASNEASQVVPAGTSTNTVTVTAPALPTGATGIRVYVGTAAGAESYIGTNAANTYTITALPAAGAALPPTFNTTYAVTETLNLTSGALLDPFGAAIAFTGVSDIRIENPSLAYPMFIFGGGTFAGPQTAPANKLWIPPGYSLSGQIQRNVQHLPGYTAGGAWKVISGVNNTLQVGSTDPNGIGYGIAIVGVK